MNVHLLFILWISHFIAAAATGLVLKLIYCFVRTWEYLKNRLQLYFKSPTSADNFSLISVTVWVRTSVLFLWSVSSVLTLFMLTNSYKSFTEALILSMSNKISFYRWQPTLDLNGCCQSQLSLTAGSPLVMEDQSAYIDPALIWYPLQILSSLGQIQLVQADSTVPICLKDREEKLDNMDVIVTYTL